MRQVKTWHRPLFAAVIAAFGLHALRAFVICPLLVEFGTNVLYMDTILVPLFDLLADLCEMAVIYICLTFILETLFRQGFRRAMPVVLVYVAAFVFGAAANLVMDLVAIGTGFDYFLFISFALGSVLLQLLQLVMILLIALPFSVGQRKVPQPDTILPHGNRLQLAALCGAAVTALFRVIGRVITDVSYGAPTSAGEVGFMVLGYASDLLIPALGYLAMVLLMMRRGAEAAEGE